jgi:hypothetical protein
MATQKRPLPSGAKARAPVGRTIEDIFDQPYQDQAFEPDIPSTGPGAGGAVAYRPVFLSLYGAYNDPTDTGALGIQIGFNAVANSGAYGSVVIGRSATASRGGISIGFYANTPGPNAFSGVAIGQRSNLGNSGGYGVAVGSWAWATGGYGVAIGGHGNAGYANSTRATGLRAIAIGFQATSPYDDATAIGPNVAAPAADSFTIGVSATEDITFDTWVPVLDTPGASHVLPILINGVRYYILLTNVAP